MKLLLDQNLSRKLIPDLESSFPGSSHVRLLDLDRSSDSDIWHYAKYHGFTFGHEEHGHGGFVRSQRCASEGVVVRVGNSTTALIRDIFVRNNKQIEEFVLDDRVVLSLFRFTAVPLP